MKVEGELDVVESRKDLERNVFLFKKPRTIKVEKLEINGIPAEWLSQKDQINQLS